MNSTPTQTTPVPATNSFSHQAAKLSWLCPMLVVLLVTFGKQAASVIVIELTALLLLLVGFIFGVIALFGIPKQGVRGILAPAIAGLLINGLLLTIFVTNFQAARARAKAQQQTSAATPTLASARP